jgi:hypothetical protein
MPTSRVMTLLEQRVPITLLCDLASTSGPDSAAINSAERPDDDVIWLDGADTRPAARTSAASA